MKQQIINHFSGDFDRFYIKYLSKTAKIYRNRHEYQTLCPFHEDTNPSFNFSNQTGQFFCHGCQAKGDIFTFYAKFNGMDTRREFKKVLEGIADEFGIRWKDKKRKVVAKYIYTDLNGKPLHRTIRTEPKNFFQERYNNGKWARGLKGIETVLYNLPNVAKAEEVILVEGEKDADNLNRLKLTATTCPMGAGKWRSEYNEALKGKHIILLPDNDDAGRKHMEKIAASLNGCAASIKLIGLPELPESGDVSDFIERCSDKDAAAERLSIMIDQADPFKPSNNNEVYKDSQITSNEDAIKKRAKEILDSQQPCGKFDTSNLPPILQEFIDEICETTEAEPITITQAALATISALLKKKVFIREGTYFQDLYPNLWMLTIAPSGDFKSTGLNKGARLAWERETEVNEQIEGAKAKGIEKEDLIRETKKARQRSAILANRSSAEALLEHLSDDCGGMIICSEFGEWLENLGKTHNVGMKALLTTLYDVPQQYSYHTKNGGYLVISQPFITINGISTLAWVKNNLRPDDVSSGFFARYLIFYPPQNRSIPPALPPRVSIQRDYQVHDKIRSILNNLPEKKFRLSDHAEEYFKTVHIQLYTAIHQESDRTQEILNPYLKRWSPYILKIAMLMQILFDDQTDSIDIKAIEAAKSIVDYAIKSTTFLFQSYLGESEHQTKQRKVLEYIAKQEGKVLRSKLHASKSLEGGSTDYDYVCESLEDAGKIVVHKPDESKKGTWYYTLLIEYSE